MTRIEGSKNKTDIKGNGKVHTKISKIVINKIKRIKVNLAKFSLEHPRSNM